MDKHTHTRKPEQVHAWQHKRGAALPDWAIAGGIHEEMLGRKIGRKIERAIPRGHWLVRGERGDTIIVMSPDQFAAEYDEA